MDKAYRKPKKKIQIHHQLERPETQCRAAFCRAVAEMLASNGFAGNLQ
jgi:hypothetical protein